MRKIHVPAVFEASGPQDHFFKKNKKPIFRYGLGECVYQISGLYRFSFGQRRDTHIYTDTTHLQVKVGISSTSCSHHVDLEYLTRP